MSSEMKNFRFKVVSLKEYGIVLLPDSEFFQKADNLNKQILSKLKDLPNTKNHWHVTLYHGLFESTDLPFIYDKLKQLKLEPLTLNFTKIACTKERWIDYEVENNDYLQCLHASTLDIACPYHKKPLKRCIDDDKNLSQKQREQVNLYGVNGVLSDYKPHMSLFYSFPSNSKLETTAKEVAKELENKNLTCKIAKLAVGELGYNGNIEQIIFSLDFPNH